MAASPAHACAALVEYFKQRCEGRQLALSRLFLHYNSQWLAMAPPGAGVGLRTALKAVAHCGLPPEHYWTYDPALAATAPPAGLYSL
ncbi:MAG TPA: hypothetical protein VHY20_05510, partial [Pirellulales bacterium]|nr:hypothetical protein [Pirellulales bacterium]